MNSDDRSSLARSISKQLHRMLEAKKHQAELIQHNLEKGLGNEQALRDLLKWFLPRRFGIGKGKVANSDGKMSRHADLIIYDAFQCPALFVDENENQILPIEGVFEVVEIKTTLTSKTLADAFENLKTVHDLKRRSNLSNNELVTGCPPALNIFAFADERSLHSIADQFDKLSRQYPVEESFSSFSTKSPGYKRHNKRRYLVKSISVLGKGCILHNLDGSIETFDWGDYTLGMFLTGIVTDFEKIALKTPNLTHYLNWIMIDEWRGTNKVEEIRSRWSNTEMD
ncbi:hypothetical protein BJ123_12277 [Rhodopseudomonas thermotolerans]|uniref:DUF6602 domain-containing protein n=2 Tax=Rhodopseudomonas TaxID=1073 RepID=A0A336JWJ4_9BRAD|nr:MULTISPECIES: DUF6602 domain-containing protein [Rhodopseudomonas]RED28549.1 hypothetical protein BJ125_12277 [Rhodopseudomonas pentothenatexigens]REF91468.1 hypothetical protein BJ123_12277 [Rhodopseudomonas thermotolerans]SSW92649.1 hypothetical protein SAMN05892882_12277 [Rhodopseudomonas pentothenatexigens]